MLLNLSDCQFSFDRWQKVRPSPRTVPCCCWEVVFTERRPSWERPQQPSAPSSLLKEQQGLFLFFFFQKCGLWALPCTPSGVMWPVGRSLGELSETTWGILLLQWHFVALLVNMFEALRAKSWDSVKVLPTSLFLSLSAFPCSSHCLCIDSINGLCLLPTFGRGSEAVLAEVPWRGGCQRMLLLTHQFLVLLGRSSPGPHLA